ncbi:MAG TPA: MG2 domain-containing protein [Prolixibacteraceae bacterium]|nr:MG2 domain-containing protein [Prolixibacteraceae bacterium]
MKSFFSPHRLLVALLFVLASCSGPDKKQTAALSDFQTYISGVTTGIIKRSDPVIIKFSHEMIPVDQLGKEAPRSVLSFEPGIDGKARWVATDALEFVPKNLLNWNTKYTATLNLSRLTEVPENLKKLEFCFQTPPKQMRIQLMGLQLSGESEGSYLLKGVVETSDEFEPSELENIFSAFQEKKKRDIAWEHQAKSCLHRFTVSGITRMEKESEVSIRWNGSKIGIKGKEEKQSVPVPSLHDFNVSSARVVNDPDPFVEVVFSDPINPDQDLRGLVVIDQTPVEQFQITENVLKLYPANRLTGMHTLVLNAAIESASGQTMDEKTAYSLNFGGMKPEVRLLGNGVIVPQSTGLFLPFEAVCLQAVDVRIRKIFTNNILSFLQDNDPDQSYRIDRVGRIMHRSRIDLANKGAVDLHSWNAFNLDLSTLIDIEPGAIYHVEIGFRKSYSLFDCNENIDEPDSFVPIDEEDLYPDKEYASVYYQQYYDWELREQPCHQAYYGPDRFAGRNILASNFGMIAKTDPNGKTHAYITNLLSANPEEGVSVEFYDYQNQLLTRATSDKEGMLSVRTERNPFLLVARKGASLAYLKIDNGSLLPTSNFDVSGNKVEKGIKGFLYGERGVWRPGDSVYVSFILDDPQTTLPMEHPLVCEVYNSKGQFVKKMVKSRGTQKMYPFFFKTNTDDPTGNWRIVVKAGGAEFSKTIRIETIKPNRLKVDIHFDDALLSAQRTSTGRLESKWLHGASAGGLKARVDVSFSSYPPVFDRFKEFDFSTPFQTYYGQEIPLFDGTLDENGRSDLIFRFKPNKEVNGFLNANFTTKIFEKGGDFSIHTFSKPFSPYKDYVGLKIDWSYKNWNKLNSDEAHVLSVATVDEQGNPIDVSGVDVKLYELEYRWWYNGDYENLASYAGKTYHKPVFQTRVNTSGGKGSFTLSRNDDRWGRHLLLVTSPNGHVAGQVVYFGWAWGRQQHKGGPQMLALVTEKDACKTGEDITVGFPANKEARALVTFESGSKIIGQQWIENLTDYTQYTFRATPEMAPNVYVHVMLIQPHGQTANDLPIRLYGVVPVRVEDPTTRIKPIIDLPDEIRPLQEFTVRVSEESKKEMEYTLAIVDEGLLDLTHFPTPDP